MESVLISNKFFVLHISFYQDQINKTNKQTDKTLKYVQLNFQLYKLSGTLWVKKRPKTFQSVSAYRVLQYKKECPGLITISMES